jgi:Lipopolysaccharide-assembly
MKQNIDRIHAVTAVGRKRPLRRTVAIAMVSLLSSACGYALAGRGSFLPAHIQVIGVPTFTNQTPYFELDQVFTDKVRAELIGRGRYKIVPESTGVDAVLTGQITGLFIQPVSFTPDQQASRYVAMITANIELRDMMDNRVIWQNPSLTFREEFDAASGTSAIDPNAFFGQSTNALQRLSSEFARAVVSAILEAF